MTEVAEKQTEKVEEVAKEETPVTETTTEAPVEAPDAVPADAAPADAEPADAAPADAEPADAAEAEETAPAVTAAGNGTINPTTERKIMKQVEYYFGDSNMNRDKFLLDQVAKDADGWVPITVLLTFKRLAALSKDATVIAEAVLKSDEGLVEVSEDKTKIRRHSERPLPEHNEERRKEIMSRTAYVKGFPLDITMDVLLEYFTAFEKVLHVSMRKYLDRPTKSYKFKGSVFATFENKEQTEKFIEKAEPKYKETTLIVKWQEKYLEEKREEQKEKANKKREKRQKQEGNKIELPKRSVVHFEGANESVTRELLRDAIERVSSDFDIAYVDFSKGDKTGHFRFYEEDSAEKFLEKLEEKKLKLSDDITLDVRTLGEEEEKTFLDKAVENMKNRRNHFNQKKSHHGNRKRRSGNDRNDEKKAKVVD